VAGAGVKRYGNRSGACGEFEDFRHREFLFR